MSRTVLILIGTRKGAFLAFSDGDRKRWALRGPFLKGAEVTHVNFWPRPQPTVFAAAKSAWWGPSLRFSTDWGETWAEPEPGLRFEKGRDLSVERVWVLEGDGRSDAGTLYAGVDPAALFRSADGGRHWEEVRSLTAHPSRDRWSPGAGGMMVHSICFDSTKTERLYVAISAAGVFRSDDSGRSWTPKNKGVRADFLPEKYPEVGVCTHHLEIHPQRPEVLYQQNHCGVYRTETAGDEWIDISEGLPSRFGFPLTVHPHDGDTIYVCPQESDQYRLTPGGALRVFRSRDRGASWHALTDGLPQAGAYQSVLRAAMSTDVLDPAGIYLGTQGGQLLASRDEGDRWELIFPWLPPISSIRTAVVEP